MKINRKKLVIVIVSAIVLSLAISFSLTKLVPFDIYYGTQIWIGEDPVTILVTSSNYNTIINITYTVYNVPDLCAWQVHVLYDPIKAIYEQTIFPSSNIFSGKTVLPVTSNLTEGNVYFGQSIIGEGSVSGTGVLAVVQYRLNSAVGSTVKFMFYSQNEETFLLDTSFNNIHYYYSNNEGTIIPEFSSIVLLMLLMSFIVVCIYIKRRSLQ